MSLYKKFSKFANPKAFFLIALVGFIGVNSTKFYQKMNQERAIRQAAPFFFHGIKFSGLQDIFQNVTFVGYYTDKDLDVKKNAAQFSQAQYELAPIILDLDYEKHAFILFDCSSEEVAIEKIKEIGAIPVKRNSFGIILARRLL